MSFAAAGMGALLSAQGPGASAKAGNLSRGSSFLFFRRPRPQAARGSGPDMSRLNGPCPDSMGATTGGAHRAAPSFHRIDFRGGEGQRRFPPRAPAPRRRPPRSGGIIPIFRRCPGCHHLPAHGYGTRSASSKRNRRRTPAAWITFPVATIGSAIQRKPRSQ